MPFFFFFLAVFFTATFLDSTFFCGLIGVGRLSGIGSSLSSSEVVSSDDDVVEEFDFDSALLRDHSRLVASSVPSVIEEDWD